MRCSCGAYPPEDARFCHKCARPLYEMVETEEPASKPVEVAAAPIPEVTITEQEPTGIRSGAGVRSALLGAFLGMGLFLIPGVGMFAIVLSPILCGLLSVWFYCRKTGFGVTVGEGARLGTMGGVFGYVILLVQFTIVVLTLRDAENRVLLEQQVAQVLKQAPEEAAKAVEAMLTPLPLFITLIVVFGVFVLIPTIAGAAAAAWRIRRH